MDWNTYEEKFKFVWVVVSEYSDSGVRGAPSAIYLSKDEAVQWANLSGLDCIIYKLPLGVSLVEYCEPVLGDQSFIKKCLDSSPHKYKSGACYLGFIEHIHINE